MDVKKKTLTAINYFGAKTRNTDFYIQRFPPEVYHYCEPFCGSAVIFLNKQQSPIETISDADSRLINFFEVLRTRYEELYDLIELTPYSRNEFQAAQLRSEDPVEDARRFYVRCMQSYGGLCDENRRVNSWRTQMSESRHGMSMAVSKYWTKLEKMKYTINRFRYAQIENRSAFELIVKYDSPKTFFFLDPPYDHDTRTGKRDYNHEFCKKDHQRLSEMLHGIKGKFMLCGYEGALYNRLYPADKFRKVWDKEKQTNMGNKINREVIWMNYNEVQGNLFNQNS